MARAIRSLPVLRTRFSTAPRAKMVRANAQGAPGLGELRIHGHHQPFQHQLLEQRADRGELAALAVYRCLGYGQAELVRHYRQQGAISAPRFQLPRAVLPSIASPAGSPVRAVSPLKEVSATAAPSVNSAAAIQVRRSLSRASQNSTWSTSKSVLAAGGRPFRKPRRLRWRLKSFRAYWAAGR
jgi:hypothetical protein